MVLLWETESESPEINVTSHLRDIVIWIRNGICMYIHNIYFYIHNLWVLCLQLDIVILPSKKTRLTDRFPSNSTEPVEVIDDSLKCSKTVSPPWPRSDYDPLYVTVNSLVADSCRLRFRVTVQCLTSWRMSWFLQTPYRANDEKLKWLASDWTSASALRCPGEKRESGLSGWMDIGSQVRLFLLSLQHFFFLG